MINMLVVFELIRITRRALEKGSESAPILQLILNV